MRTNIIVFTTALLLASPVAAKPAAPQKAVSFSDLDLSRDSDQQQLNRRIHAAVRSVCPADPGLTEMSRHRISTQCIAETNLRMGERIAALTGRARVARG